MDLTNRKTHIYEKISSLLIISLGLLIPTFFLTLTTEFFEFNKLALLTIITLMLVLLLGAKVLAGSPIQFVKSTIDLPLFVYLVLFIIATVFSTDKMASIWGAQGRWYPSLFGLVVLMVFYYLGAPNFKDSKSIKLALASLVAGGTISSAVALLGYFGIFLGQAAVFRNPAFTLTGSTTTALLIAGVVMSLSLFFAYTEKNIAVKAAYISAMIINFALLAFVGGVMSWTLAIIALAGNVYILGVNRFAQDRFVTMFLTTIVAVVALLNMLPATRSIVANSNYPAEITLPVKASWVVASATIQDYPLLATGPSTFQLNYTRYKPLFLNNTNIWNIRFDKPFNEIFNTLGTLGILGLVALIYLGFGVTKYVASNVTDTQNELTSKAIAIAVAVTGVGFLFTYATITNTFVIFYLLALLGAAHSLNASNKKYGEIISFSFSTFAAATTTIGEASAIRKEYANIVAVTPFVVASLFGVYLFGRTYLAEYYMRNAIVAALGNKLAQAYDFQGKAINANPRKDVYHTAYAQTNLILANALAGKKDLTDQDKQTIQTLVSQAIRSTRVATEAINPQNIANWETRALIYRSLINVADNAAEWAIGAYNTAIQLDPTNPALRIDLGGVYYAKADYLAAANLFRQATALKNDYANAHYNFAQALINLNDIENAKRELDATKSLVPQGSDDAKRVEEQIAALNAKQPTVAGATTEKKPTVEEITGATTENKQATKQEPLSNPSVPNNGAANLNPSALPNSTSPTPAATPTPTPNAKKQ